MGSEMCIRDRCVLRLCFGGRSKIKCRKTKSSIELTVACFSRVSNFAGRGERPRDQSNSKTSRVPDSSFTVYSARITSKFETQLEKRQDPIHTPARHYTPSNAHRTTTNTYINMSGKGAKGLSGKGLSGKGAKGTMKGGDKKKPTSRSVKAGLQFPVGRIHRFLKVRPETAPYPSPNKPDIADTR